MNKAGAAVAAAQLLALYADPLGHRPRLTHGREAFPGAIHAFRFAQGRFPEEVMQEMSAFERARLREAAVFFIRQVCLWDGASHYQVLGVSRDATRGAVKEHYHALMGLLHPDRRVAGSERWPSTAASRVNKAYAVLSDATLRGEYDTVLDKGIDAAPRFSGAVPDEPSAISSPVAAGRRVGAARARYVRNALFGTAALATLFFLNAWWAGNDPGEYATLRSAASLEAPTRWLRDPIATVSLPRFLATGERPASGPPPEAEPVTARRIAVEPLRVPVPHARAIEPLEAMPGIIRMAQAQPAPLAVPETVVREETVRIPPLAAPVQARQPSPAEEAGIAELELLVVQLVSHYEAGDVDRLIGLFDSASVSVREAVGMRRDLEQFFGSTSARQLRLRTISWDSTSQPTSARGEAILQAAYGDRPERIERVVAVGLGFVWREGRPRIARMSLFPHE